jgi:glycosyltransferase involved in cell wall biosynthesis
MADNHLKTVDWDHVSASEPQQSEARLRSLLGPARVAVVHEWLVDYSGSERVLEQMLAVLPQADLFATVEFLPENLRDFIQRKPVTTTFIQGLPGARKRYRNYLPLMPMAVEQTNLSEYDLVVSSSHAVAKGVLTGPRQLHLCMCYTPMRYAWDLQHQYLQESGLDKGLKGWIARWLLHRLRIWDLRTAAGVDGFIAISQFIAERIRKNYRRDSVVIYPPVNVDAFQFKREKQDFYLTASRMVPYKKMDVIVEAFAAMPNRRLIVIGDGPDAAKIRSRKTPNVSFLGYQAHEVLRDHMQRACAFIFAAEEDFGIAPLEAQACGTPVIAYGRGGALETIRGLQSEAPTGVFFEQQSVDALCDAVQRFEINQSRITPENCRENAQRFSPERFRAEFANYVEHQWTHKKTMDSSCNQVDGRAVTLE